MSDVDKSGWGVWWIDDPVGTVWVGPEVVDRVKFQASNIAEVSIGCGKCWPEVVEALGDRAYCRDRLAGRVEAVASVWIAAARRPGCLPGAVLPAKGDATAAEYQAAGRAVRATREAEEERPEAARAMRERSPGWGDATDRPLGPNVQYTFSKAQLDRAMTAGWEPWAVPLAEWLVRRAEEAAEERVPPGPETRTVEVRAPAPMVAGYVPEAVVREWLGDEPEQDWDANAEAWAWEAAGTAGALSSGLRDDADPATMLGLARTLAAEALLLVDRLSGAPEEAPPRKAAPDLVAGVLPRSTVMEWLRAHAVEAEMSTVDLVRNTRITMDHAEEAMRGDHGGDPLLFARMLMAEAALLVDRFTEEEPAERSHPPSASDPLEPCVVLNPRPDAKTLERGEEPEVVAPEGAPLWSGATQAVDLTPSQADAVRTRTALPSEVTEEVEASDGSKAVITYTVDLSDPAVQGHLFWVAHDKAASDGRRFGWPEWRERFAEGLATAAKSAAPREPESFLDYLNRTHEDMDGLKWHPLDGPLKTPDPDDYTAPVVTHTNSDGDGTVYAKMADGSARLLTPEDVTEKRPTITLCPDCHRVPGADQAGGCVECGAPVVGVVDEASAEEVARLFVARAQRDALLGAHPAPIILTPTEQRALRMNTSGIGLYRVGGTLVAGWSMDEARELLGDGSMVVVELQAPDEERRPPTAFEALQSTHRALVAQVEDLERRLERHRAEHLRAFEEGL